MPVGESVREGRQAVDVCAARIEAAGCREFPQGIVDPMAIQIDRSQRDMDFSVFGNAGQHRFVAADRIVPLDAHPIERFDAG